MALEIITEDFELYWKRGKDKDYKRADYDELIKSYEKQEKYKWHDLQKNPEDLPNKTETDYLTISMNGMYIVRTYDGVRVKGFVDSYGHDLKTHQRKAMQVKAWREIELFRKVK